MRSVKRLILVRLSSNLVRFAFDDQFYDLIDYTRPKDKNYMILESLNQVKENNNYKSIHVITLENEEKIKLVILL